MLLKVIFWTLSKFLFFWPFRALILSWRDLLAVLAKVLFPNIRRPFFHSNPFLLHSTYGVACSLEEECASGGFCL